MIPFLSSLGASGPTVGGAGEGGSGGKTGLAKQQEMKFQNDAEQNSRAAIDGAISGFHGPIINLGTAGLTDSASTAGGNTWFMVALGVAAAVILLLVLRR